MTDNVILVDQNDKEIGSMSKMQAHLSGTLHRAFSIFIFNKKGQLLLQQRALGKYHSGGKWTNTCCSHPRIGEKTIIAANRRLQEEMGMECDLIYGFSFLYKADVKDGLLEHEYDHVYFGSSDDKPTLNPDEVSAYKYIDLDILVEDLRLHPDLYTEWLKISFDQVLAIYRTKLTQEN
ncbi:isopentenyl-diphosphate Delta-isomerase [Pedobacter polaris]|uniref:Isopentenyl-diphosphate delta-isomerase n=1 Tax=Pedobacter polaris TaxID=2571273 RepID=A0A4U1CSF1_9SPHI|nr:isopentenyl-diphosphate Delta-isomerase [Pedobacter polaris]TKC09955.1 isopentenyl-diphosphate Delta-isomerase [Pedobacter polaris]